MKKLLVVALLLISIASNAQSTRQSFNRYSFWTETVINGSIKNKWKWQLDYQYRRCSDPSNLSTSKNIFENPYQHVYRPWVHYQLNDNVRFSLSPIGFWETYTSSLEGGGKPKIQPEFRICPQVTLSNKIGRVIIDQRYRFEYRFMGNKVDNTSTGLGYSLGDDYLPSAQKGRIRYFVRAIVPLNHKKLEDNTFYITTWNEMFISVGKNVADNKIWDQNRTFCLLGYKPKMSVPMRFELGYGLQYANRYGTIDYLEKNNILQAYIIFENFNKIFTKK